jgi:hypothetical protein
MNSFKQINEIIKIVQNCKDEIKGTQCHKEEDSMKHLSYACLSIILKFFENLKKQLRKSEHFLNFNIMDVGHLIALSVGHTDRPTDEEARYIKIVMKSSNFKYNPDEFEGISPTPLVTEKI